MTGRARAGAGAAALLAVALAVAVAVYLWGERGPAPDDSPAPPERPRVEERSPAPRSATSLPAPSISNAPGPEPERPGSPGPAASMPGAPGAPPDAVSTATEENPEIAPEAPQTPEWKLEKTVLISDSLARRARRLEVEIREAEARGDGETAARQRALLDRSRRRVVELEQEITSLKEQVRADAGAPGTSP